MKTVSVTKDNVKIIGRSFCSENILWFALSGSGIAFTYTGRKLEMTLKGSEASTLSNNSENYARIAVYADGERVIDDQLNAPEKTYTILDSTEEKTVKVQLIKLSECAMSLCGVVSLSMDETGVLMPAEKKKIKMEIIGDSITCGYGVDDENCEHHFSTGTEDVTKAYSYKTVTALDVDYSFFSISGYGIISGYTDDISVIHDDQRIPDFYDYMGFSYDTYDGTHHPQDIPWDFSTDKPDMIVINLGTNDDSYCQDDVTRQETYCARYVDFLKQVRSHNPNAVLFCVLGLMGSRLFPYIEKACSQFRSETGESRLYTVLLPEQDGNIGYAADYHPMERFHTAAAQTLSQAIKPYLSSLS